VVSWTTVRFDHLAKWVIISTRRPAIIDPDVSDLLKRVELDPLLTDATRASLYRADEPLRFLKGLYFPIPICHRTCTLKGRMQLIVDHSFYESDWCTTGYE
jgi:hypothetical protein